MADRVSDNIIMIMRVVERLAPLKDRFAFLGGAVTELFITSPAAMRTCSSPRTSCPTPIVKTASHSCSTASAA